MKHVLFSLVILLSFTACQNKEKNQRIEEIVAFEEAFEKEANDANRLALIAKYNEYVQQFPDDDNLSPRYLYRIASMYYENGDKGNALKFLEQNIETYDNGEATPRSLMLQGKIYKENGNMTKAIIAFSELVRKYPNHPEAPNAQSAIPSDDILDNQIAKFQEMIKDTTLPATINRSAYPQLANAYVQYVSIHPEDEKAAKKLTDAGELYMSVGDAKSAVNVWEKVLANYPDSEFARKAHIQLAFNYENALRDIEKAKELYTSFLEKYPNDDFATSAQFSLDNLGKSPDEVFENMIKK